MLTVFPPALVLVVAFYVAGSIALLLANAVFEDLYRRRRGEGSCA